jgi:hypothetical protein
VRWPGGPATFRARFLPGLVLNWTLAGAAPGRLGLARASRPMGRAPGPEAAAKRADEPGRECQGEPVT